MSDPDDEMLTVREVGIYFGGKEKPVDVSTIYRWVAKGYLAKGVAIGVQTRRWRKSDCHALRAKLMSGEIKIKGSA